MPIQADSSSKLHIPEFPSAMDEIYINRIAEDLREAIENILRRSGGPLKFEELYRNAYTMVLQKNGDKLYQQTKYVLEEHVKTIQENVIRNMTPAKFLQVLYKHWLEFYNSIGRIQDILMYIDITYVSQNNLLTISDMALVVFRDSVVHFPSIRKYLTDTLLGMIQKERQSETIARNQFKEVTEMLLKLGVGSLSVYEEDFERQFLLESRTFYAVESDKVLENCDSVISYLRRVEQRIEEEIKRSNHYLHPSTEKKVVQVVKDEMLNRKLSTIVYMEGSGLINMFELKQFENISLMYKLLCQIDNGITEMSSALSNYLRSKALSIVEDEKAQPQNYIRELFNLRERFDELELNGVSKDILIHRQINQDFVHIVNLNSRTPEYLSLFMDDYLRHATDNNNEEFDKCIVLFRYIAEKDIFEYYYKQHLAKRLLSKRTQSEEQEKAVITILKSECGGQFTSKFESMFRDMTISKILMEEFNKENSSNTQTPSIPFTLDVVVLTSGIWPTQQIESNNLYLPDYLRDAFQRFLTFYMSRHNGRQLRLQPNYGTCDLEVTFYPKRTDNQPNTFAVPAITNNSNKGNESAAPSSDPNNLTVGGDLASMRADVAEENKSTPKEEGNKKLLTVTTYQMSLLLLFNLKNQYTFQELLNESNIPQQELLRCLHSLAMARSSQRILQRHPSSTKDIGPQDMFSVNDQFTSKHYKIRVQNVALKEPTLVHQESCVQVDKNRKYVIEAAIVRVMKAKETLSHSLLISEVTDQLKNRFLPSPSTIKSQIESLIDREFLERTEDRKSYRYIA